MNQGTQTTIVVGMGDMKVGQAPTKILTTVGSCIALCLYSYEKKNGGLLHFMIASSEHAKKSANFKIAKYADTGIPELLRLLDKTYGIKKHELTAKIFGGAKVLKEFTTDIGGANVAAAKKILKELGIPIKASNVGGDKGFRIEFDLTNGMIICNRIGEEVKQY